MMLRPSFIAVFVAISSAGCAVSADVPGYTNASGGAGATDGGGSGGSSGSGGGSATGGSSGSGGSPATGGSSGSGTGGSSGSGTGGSSGSGTGGSSGSGSGGSSGSGTGGSSGSGTGGSSGSGGSGGGACQDASCQQATSAGTVSGDTGGQSVYLTGSAPRWVQVRVTEDNSSAIGQKLKVTATLNSPAGENFDLYVYLNEKSDVALECSALAGSSTNGAGATDTVTKSWGEGALANGSDDSRNVSIEVRAAAGTTCNPNNTWTLTVKGN